MTKHELDNSLDEKANDLVRDVKGCKICESYLPLGANPVFQFHPLARILIAGHAPGRKVHLSGISFDDASGDRLRDWMGISRNTFYQAHHISVLPMGFCYPGRGKSGDLPPRKECAVQWRDQFHQLLKDVQLTILLGQYAMDYYLPHDKKMGKKNTVTQSVLQWQDNWPHQIVLPHPSPRNNIWLKKNPWFETDVVPQLKERVAAILTK